MGHDHVLPRLHGEVAGGGGDAVGSTGVDGDAVGIVGAHDACEEAAELVGVLEEVRGNDPGGGRRFLRRPTMPASSETRGRGPM